MPGHQSRGEEQGGEKTELKLRLRGGSNIFNKVHVLAKLLSLTKMLAVLYIIRSTFNLP